MLVTPLDLITKVGFGLIALNASAVLAAELGFVPEAASGPGSTTDGYPGAEPATDD